MTRNKNAILEELLQHFTPEDLLNELVQAMSTQEAKENFEHIILMHGLDDIDVEVEMD